LGPADRLDPEVLGFDCQVLVLEIEQFAESLLLHPFLRALLMLVGVSALWKDEFILKGLLLEFFLRGMEGLFDL